ncbi:MAG TPA: hypothetical protein VHW02_10870 [Rhizomicrobium sp.]|jgi:hypothetical protein|nr:hypothetical protein [Rhizomicrobium sp.]
MRFRPAVIAAIAIVSILDCAAAQADSNLAAKLSALQKACDVGVFSPQECAQRRAALQRQGAHSTPAAQADPRPAAQSAANTYRDPQGRFSAPVPDGWNASDSNGTAQLSSGADWIMLIPSGATQPDQGATEVVHQMQSQFQSLNQAGSGRPKINGHDAVYVVFQGVNPKGEQVAVMVAGIQAPGNHVLVFVSSAPQSEINAVSPKFLQVMNGIRFAGEQP